MNLTANWESNPGTPDQHISILTTESGGQDSQGFHIYIIILHKLLQKDIFARWSKALQGLQPKPFNLQLPQVMELQALTALVYMRRHV